MNPKFRSIRMLLPLAILLLIGCTVGEALDPSPIPPPPNLNDGGSPGTGSDDEAGVPTPLGEEGATDPTPTAEVLEGPEGPTPIPTPTLAPTAVPNTIPPIESVTTLPASSRDLLFIGDGALKLWTHADRQVSTIIPGGVPTADQPRTDRFSPVNGDVTQLDVSADGNRAVVARINRTELITETVGNDDNPVVTSNFYTEHEIIFIDLVSQESWVLAEAVVGLVDISIAPNQQTVTFVATDTVAATEPSLPKGEPPVQNVYVVNTPVGTVRQIASCVQFCSQVVWRDDSALFLYGDGEALWLFNMTASEPEPLLDNQIGDPSQVRVFTPLDWANNGRYVLLFDGRWEGGSRAVFDIPTGQVMPVPDSFLYASPFPVEVQWMADTRLLVSRANIDQSRSTLELWRVSVEEGRLVREEQVTPEVAGLATGTLHLENGRFAYGLVNRDSAAQTGLYVQTSFNEPTERVNGLLPGFVAPVVVWAPDGSGAIVEQNGLVLYAVTNGGLYDIGAQAGLFAHSFTWLPPSNAPR